MSENPTKAFRITRGRGFKMKFPNGYTVSVQFGPMNYCENYGRLDPLRDRTLVVSYLSFQYTDLVCGSEGSDDCETAIITPDEGYLQYDPKTKAIIKDGSLSDNVQARMSVMDVLAMMNIVAALPAAEHTMVCAECGDHVMPDPAGSKGVLVHGTDGKQDHEADMDHVPYTEEGVL